MSMLSKGTRGVIVRPKLMLVYGVDGVGKSTFGSTAPNPVFLGPESGTDNLDVFRLPTPDTWEDVMQSVKDLTFESHQPYSGSTDFGTLVIDTVDWLEPLVTQSVLADYPKAKTIEQAAGGYGKGYIEIYKKWLDFKSAINLLREKRKMHVILLGHSSVTKFLDPQLQETIDRYELKLYKTVSPLLREWVDMVIFVNYKTEQTEDKGTERKRFYGDGDRVMYTERRPGWDAKNRFGLPLEMEFKWETLMDEIKNGTPDSPNAIRARIEGHLSVMQNTSLVEIIRATVAKAGDFTIDLKAIEERIKIRVKEDAESQEVVPPVTATPIKETSKETTADEIPAPSDADAPVEAQEA